MTRKKRERKQYSETFKARAVKLASTSSSSVSKVARELGVAEKTLHCWVRADAVAQEVGIERLTASEKEELKALRAENKRLRDDAEILKKAATYFANQSP